MLWGLLFIPSGSTVVEGFFLLNELFGMLSNTLDKKVEKLKINEMSHASAAMCCFDDAHVEQSSLSFLSLCLATVSIPW